MRVFVLLNVITVIVGWVGHLPVRQSAELPWLAVAVVGAWRVAHGGRVWRVFLILGSGWYYITAVLSVARF